ncbi:MAG TPA: IS1380 family transposase [Gemmatimonadales bacterium]|nr:IS1380 family transposase [Gemmatimonadales bacterium]
MVTTRTGRRKGAWGRLDGLKVAFDDGRAVANAGLLLSATLAERLGIEALADRMIDLGRRPGAFRPGRKVMSLVHSMVVGGDAIDDADVLRTGATARVLGHRVMAPSTLGTFLRSFSFGNVRQLDRLAEAALTGAWSAGAGPGAGPMTIDLDSTICEVHGHHKGGASYGYTRVLGYHPLLATRADTGELLHARLRTGKAHSARGAVRFCQELAPRVRRAGARGPLTVRADSGFWSAKIIEALRRHRIRFSITVRQTGPVRRTIAAIPEQAWVPIDYPAPGIAEVAQTRHEGERLIVRRVRHEAEQTELVLDWRHHAFVTDRDGDALALDVDHRAHAVVELAIRDLKEGAGLAHCPSGRFFANAAWLVLSCLAHNLLRWVAAIGLRIPGAIVAKTVRRRYLTLPGRITRSGRRQRLHLPSDWPWAEGFLAALGRLRTLAAPT